MIILIVATLVGDQSEKNAVVDTIRLGATNATTNIVISSNNIPIRVTEVAISGSNPINITIQLSRSVTNPQKVQILGNVNSSLVSQGYSPNYNGVDTNIFLNTTKHNYSISVSP
ncbi:class III signal peptide-containing protein [uncultured Methanobacterium sp.]|uniref:class III signal peptide-containing protein n=1 Tax=uncultured Methanobacterium sp. TaxID=176306 RepID=UPI0037490BDD